MAIGVDPGSRDGAAVLLDGDRRVASWVVWYTRTREKQEQLVYQMSRSPATVIDEPAEALEAWLRYSRAWLIRASHVRIRHPVAVEGLFALSKSSAHSALVLGESAGVLIGLLRPYAVHPIRRPLATDWRWRVLSIPQNTPAEEAERIAVEKGPIAVDWSEVGGFPDWLPKKARGAVAEAACIARDVATNNDWSNERQQSRQSFRRRSRWSESTGTQKKWVPPTKRGKSC